MSVGTQSYNVTTTPLPTKTPKLPFKPAGSVVIKDNDGKEVAKLYYTHNFAAACEEKGITPEQAIQRLIDAGYTLDEILTELADTNSHGMLDLGDLLRLPDKYQRAIFDPDGEADAPYDLELDIHNTANNYDLSNIARETNVHGDVIRELPNGQKLSEIHVVGEGSAVEPYDPVHESAIIIHEMLKAEGVDIGIDVIEARLREALANDGKITYREWKKILGSEWGQHGSLLTRKAYKNLFHVRGEDGKLRPIRSEEELYTRMLYLDREFKMRAEYGYTLSYHCTCTKFFTYTPEALAVIGDAVYQETQTDTFKARGETYNKDSERYKAIRTDLEKEAKKDPDIQALPDDDGVDGGPSSRQKAIDQRVNEMMGLFFVLETQKMVENHKYITKLRFPRKLDISDQRVAEEFAGFVSSVILHGRLTPEPEKGEDPSSKREIFRETRRHLKFIKALSLIMKDDGFMKEFDTLISGKDVSKKDEEGKYIIIKAYKMWKSGDVEGARGLIQGLPDALPVPEGRWENPEVVVRQEDNISAAAAMLDDKDTSNDAQAVGDLIHMAKTGYYTRRIKAIEALAGVPEDQKGKVVEALKELLLNESASPAVREKAAEVLVKLTGAGLYDEMIEIAKTGDNDENKRAGAIAVLAKIALADANKKDDIVKYLKVIADDEKQPQKVRAAATAALKKINPEKTETPPETE